MATQNAINNAVNLPATVGDGGTGTTSLTDHSVLIGSGAGAITAITVGATGELLVGVSGADPAFGTSTNGAFTFTSAAAGTDRILTVSNTDNSNAASAATVQLTTGGTSSGDSAVKWSITGGVNYSMGIDNSATGDPLKISNSAALGTTDSWVMTTAGERTLPLQPAFLAYNGTTDSDVTGDGTVFTMEFNTEVFDQNGDYDNATDTFTAPVTGRYHLEASAYLQGVAAGHTTGSMSIVTTNGTYQQSLCNPGVMVAGSDFCFTSATFCDMTAGDTAYVTIVAAGSTKVIDVYGTAATYTYFSGYLAV